MYDRWHVYYTLLSVQHVETRKTCLTRENRRAFSTYSIGNLRHNLAAQMLCLVCRRFRVLFK